MGGRRGYRTSHATLWSNILPQPSSSSANSPRISPIDAAAVHNPQPAKLSSINDANVLRKSDTKEETRRVGEEMNNRRVEKPPRPISHLPQDFLRKMTVMSRPRGLQWNRECYAARPGSFGISSNSTAAAPDIRPTRSSSIENASVLGNSILGRQNHGRRCLWLVQGARSAADTLRGLPRVLLHLIPPVKLADLPSHLPTLTRVSPPSAMLSLYRAIVPSSPTFASSKALSIERLSRRRTSNMKKPDNGQGYSAKVCRASTTFDLPSELAHRHRLFLLRIQPRSRHHRWQSCFSYRNASIYVLCGGITGPRLPSFHIPPQFGSSPQPLKSTSPIQTPFPVM